MSRELCERLCNLDESYVNKYDGNDLENLLNEKVIGSYGYYYRVFEDDTHSNCIILQETNKKLERFFGQAKLRLIRTEFGNLVLNKC